MGQLGKNVWMWQSRVQTPEQAVGHSSEDASVPGAHGSSHCAEGQLGAGATTQARAQGWAHGDGEDEEGQQGLCVMEVTQVQTTAAFESQRTGWCHQLLQGHTNKVASRPSGHECPRGPTADLTLLQLWSVMSEKVGRGQQLL